MRKILALCTAILLIFTLGGCQNSEPPKNPVNPPFFVVKDEKTGGEVYMLGSMHVGLPNTVYPDAVYEALDKCSSVACEIDLIRLNSDNAEVNEASKVFLCSSAKELLGEDYDEIKSYFVEKGIYSARFEKFIPAMWSIALTKKASSDSGYSSEYGTELDILALAKSKNKKIIELETAAEQYAINAGQSLDFQIYSLKSSIEMPYETLKAQNNALYSAWSESNTLMLEMMLSQSDVPKEFSEDFAKFYSEMYEKRQEKMADFVIKSLQNGDKIFFMVGAAHFYAKPDILDFLENAGYYAQAETLANAA